MTMRSNILLFLAICLPATCSAFVMPSMRNSVETSFRRPTEHVGYTSTTTCLLDQPPGEKQVKADGTGRGAILLGVVLAACVWIFSIPPEYRRAYLCGSERCVQDRQAYLCNDCMTPEEWRSGIIEYYKNGGGVKFDFSVDPNSQFRIK